MSIFGKKRILIVEKDTAVADYIAMIVQENKRYRAVLSSPEEDALNSMNSKIHLVFTSYNGHERVLEKYPKTQVILVRSSCEVLRSDVETKFVGIVDNKPLANKEPDMQFKEDLKYEIKKRLG